MDLFICPIDITCGILSCIGIYCCCYWGVAMRYENVALQQTDDLSKAAPSKSKSKSKSKSEQKQYNSDNGQGAFTPPTTNFKSVRRSPEKFGVKRIEPQFSEADDVALAESSDLSHFYGDESDIVNKLPDENEGIFTSSRFLRMFSFNTGIPDDSTHAGQGSKNPTTNLVDDRRSSDKFGPSVKSSRNEKVHPPSPSSAAKDIEVGMKLSFFEDRENNVERSSELNVKNMIKLPPIMGLYKMYEPDKFGQGSKNPTTGVKRTDDIALAESSGSKRFLDSLPRISKLRKGNPTTNNLVDDRRSSENFGATLRSKLLLRENPSTNDVSKIPESLEPDNMVPEHYIIKKKSPKNNVVNFVHKKKSIFFSNTSPHSIDAITGVILGTKKTSQTPRLETQKSMYNIRMNNASNFVLSLE